MISTKTIKLQKKIMADFNFANIFNRQSLRKMINSNIDKDVLFLFDEDAHSEEDEEFMEELKKKNCAPAYMKHTKKAFRQGQNLMSCIVDDDYYLVLFEYRRNISFESFVISKNHFSNRVRVKYENKPDLLVYIFHPDTSNFVPKELIEKYKRKYIAADRKEKIRKALNHNQGTN